MKAHAIAALAAIAALTASATDADATIFDARTKAVIAADTGQRHKQPAKAAQHTLYYPVIIEIEDDSALEQLDELGTVIWRRRDNMLLGCIPRQNLPRLQDIALVSSATVGSRLSLASDRSRQWSNVAPVHTGTATDKCGQLDGSGVTVGLCDIGIDPNHIAFRKGGDADAPSRVGLVTHYVDSTAQRLVADTPEAVAAWTTDTPDETHGTHVCAIMASGYTGNPYYGYAPGADIVATTSQLFDVALLCGIEDIIERAQTLGQPAVANLSISSLIGPRDGTDAVCRYIDKCAQDAVICFAAGNYGLSKFAIHHDFTAEAPTIGTIIDNRATWSGIDVSGYTDIWCRDGSPLQIRLVIYNLDTKEFVYRSQWYGGTETEGTATIATGAPGAWTSDIYNDGSSVTISWDTDKHNGRTHIAAISDMHSTALQQAGPWSRYFFGYEIKGNAGASVDIYADGSQTFLRSCGIPGMTEGTAEGAFNNLASPASVLAIGGYDNRATVPMRDGTETTYSGINPGYPMPYTSYGTTFDGRHIPDFCAPANTVISAMNRYYHDAHPDGYTVLVQTEAGGTAYQWYDEGGTSMASPAVAGIAALWLQADRTLTAQDIRDIVANSARTDLPDPANPRWGLGAIDAAAGLRYHLDHQGVGDTAIDAYPAIPVSTSYHDLLGRPIPAPSAKAAPPTPTFPSSTTPPSTYCGIILRTDTYPDGSRRTTRLLLR